MPKTLTSLILSALDELAQVLNLQNLLEIVPEQVEDALEALEEPIEKRLSRIDLLVECYLSRIDFHLNNLNADLETMRNQIGATPANDQEDGEQ